MNGHDCTRHIHGTVDFCHPARTDLVDDLYNACDYLVSHLLAAGRLDVVQHPEVETPLARYRKARRR